MSLEGYATAVQQTTEVVCAYASGEKTLPAYTSAHWIKVGAFTVPRAVSARLVVLGTVAGSGTSLAVKLFGPAAVANSTATLTAAGESEVRSGIMALLPGVLYCVGVACTASAEDDEHFGSVTTVSLGNV